MRAPCFLEPGEQVEYTRTITADDIVAFACISGDDDPVHVNEDFARQTAFGRCIAHGAHVMGLLSTTASMMSRRSVSRGATGTPVSAGYDRIRFIRPVFAGETLTARYTIEQVDDARGRSHARLEVVNQDGRTCLVGTHVLAWVPPA
ncbi:MAG TPA: MaoC family dehydratase [Falsiroseomonas sp.]|jgi:acyl dehydratase|nr:MaoC family dehydratase [Falsiroseomonas sp.]